LANFPSTGLRQRFKVGFDSSPELRADDGPIDDVDFERQQALLESLNLDRIIAGTAVARRRHRSRSEYGFSDIRLKTNIVDSGSALIWFDKIRIRDFTIKSTGIIAQELQLTHPELVHSAPEAF
jgi:hypothetical protein